jgi:two-component system nitrogen regulation response regulator GlnG
MLCYRWPGNVRQLRSVVRRAVLTAEDLISDEHIGLKPGAPIANATELLAEDERTENFAAPGQGRDDLSLREIVRSNTVHVERTAIVHVLMRTGGNKAKAARLLQVDYKTLHSKVKEYGIQIKGVEANA